MASNATPSHWHALERLFSPNHCASFMFMHATTQDNRTIYSYKHIRTRRYLTLDDTGQAYRYALTDARRYEPIPLGDAIAYVLS